jgi:hypothetical protein
MLRERGAAIAQTYEDMSRTISDAHMRSAFKDFMMGMFKPIETKQLAEWAPDMSKVAADMGFRGMTNAQLSSIGRGMAKRFRAQENRDPDMTEKYVNGAIRNVKAYRHEFIPMMQEEIRKVL